MKGFDLLCRTPQLSSQKKLIIALVIYVGCLFYFLFQGGKTSVMLLAMSSLLGIYWLAVYYGGIRRVQGNRIIGGRAKGRILAQSSLAVDVRLHVPGWLPLPYLIVRDELRRFDKIVHQQHSVVVLDETRIAKMQYVLPPLQRGYYEFGTTTCTSRDLFGLFEAQGKCALGQPFYVQPVTVPIRSWNVTNSGHGGSRINRIHYRNASESTQISGTRAYIPGDRLSRIHWNATAKTGELKSKQFEQEASTPIMIVLDRTATAYRSEEAFELAVSAVASIVQFAVRLNRPVSIIASGQELTVWDNVSIRTESTAYKHWFASVQSDPVTYSGAVANEPLWLNQLYHIIERQQGTVVAWISGSTSYTNTHALQKLARYSCVGSYIHIDGDHGVHSEHSAAFQAEIMKYRYGYIPLKELRHLPLLLGGGRR
ncbi:DUF58 domain-containing protein [Paenibacillus sp. 481]|uniref:DUF58 domain-containing protein n=1 Tax=Paenibacillus sp. 481 TaxID=2835869 RepID=UPI001E58B8CF|nr:DUF58 domain-containing protein [Paenibacillus sp. 481]UHA74232.1 DUF58 domain-containing protein [Paenibacillus sp. 481]